MTEDVGIKFRASHKLFVKPFSPTAKLAMGSLAQNSSGAIRCSCNTEKVPEVPEGSGADG